MLSLALASGLLAVIPARASAQVKAYAASYRGTQSVHVLVDAEVFLVVEVYSKWVQRNGVGVAQLRVVAIPTIPNPEPRDDDARAGIRQNYITRMEGCRVFLKLRGGDGFPLGDSGLSITNEVDDKARNTSLEGDGSLTMSAASYRDFVQHETWEFNWKCPASN